jgi:tripartite-type tricarboxylate transporter receptor subunit TctC
MRMRCPVLSRVLLAWLILAVTALAHSQAYPTKPVRVIVPFPPGGTADLMGRILAQELPPRLGQTLVVDNRPGAGGKIGLETAAAAPADGYTLLLGTVDTQCILGHLHKDLKFNPATGFAPVMLLVRQENAIATGARSPLRSLSELFVQAQKQPVQFASPGLGSHLHLMGEILNRRLNLKLEHVAYKGVGLAIPDVVAGRMQLLLAGVPPLLPMFRDGRLRALATTGSARNAELADVPTLAESGQRDLVITGWFGLLAPRSTPPAIIERLAREIRAVADSESFRQRLSGTYLITAMLGPADFAAFIAAEAKRWGAAAQGVNLRGE